MGYSLQYEIKQTLHGKTWRKMQRKLNARFLWPQMTYLEHCQGQTGFHCHRKGVLLFI